MTLSQPRSVVTGSASGLGRAFCVELGKMQGRVLVSDVDLDGAEETAELVRREGGEARVATCDVREAEQVAGLARAASDWFGDTDLLVNNAGVAVSGNVGEISLEDWRWVVETNLWGVIYGCHAFVPAMLRRRSGHVVNVASLAGLVSSPGLAPYNVTKAGVVALSETMHAELRKTGVRVTVLCPTFFQSNIVQASRGVLEEHLKELAHKAMKNAAVQAPGVARAALQAVQRNQLYTLPMRDGRLIWRIKRYAPDVFSHFVPSIAQEGTFLNKLLARG